jgi:hypothetical protein
LNGYEIYAREQAGLLKRRIIILLQEKVPRKLKKKLKIKLSELEMRSI